MMKIVSKLERTSRSLARHPAVRSAARGFSAVVWTRAVDLTGTYSLPEPEVPSRREPPKHHLLDNYSTSTTTTLSFTQLGVWSHHLSFSSPESDFASPLKKPDSSVRHYNTGNMPHLFVDTPETAFGSVSITEMLDEDSLLQLQRFHEPEQPEAIQEMQTKAEEMPKVYDDTPLPKSLDEVFENPHDPRAMVVTHVDAPYEIFDVNDAWVGLCGYSREEAHKRSLARLLEGPATERHLLQDFMEQLVEGHESTVVVTNYTKEGRKFRNRVRAGPIHDPEHPYLITHFVGILEEVPMKQNMAV